MEKGKSNSLFRIDPEYYTFISGALISIPISLLLEISTYYDEYTFWLGLIFSILTSFFCFKLSIILKEINEEYASNIEGVGNNTKAWNAAFNPKKTKCINYLILIVVTFILTIVFVSIMQFTGTSASITTNVICPKYHTKN